MFLKVNISMVMSNGNSVVAMLVSLRKVGNEWGFYFNPVLFATSGFVLGDRVDVYVRERIDSNLELLSSGYRVYRVSNTSIGVIVKGERVRELLGKRVYEVSIRKANR